MAENKTGLITLPCGVTHYQLKGQDLKYTDNLGGRRDTPGIKSIINVREKLGHREHMGIKTHTRQSTILTLTKQT